VVLRSEIYAVASLIGSVIVAVGRPLGAPDLLPLVGAATTTCVIRGQGRLATAARAVSVARGVGGGG
jgi:uncharacterized membrane protein YeiH